MAEAEAPKMPKLSIKMLVFPAMFFLVKKVDLKDPDILNYARVGFCTSVLFLALVYGYVFAKVQTSPNGEKVFIPPPPNPAAWIIKMMGQEVPEDAKAYTKSSIKEHEVTKVQEAIQTLLFTGAMGLAMTFMFNVHQVLVMQGVLLPVNALDNVLIQKYILGATKNDEGQPLWGETTEDPMAKAAVTDDKDKAASGSKEGSERVEILSEESHKDKEDKKEGGLKKRAGKGAGKKEENIGDIDE